MNASVLEQIKQQLVDKKTQLEKELGLIADPSKTVDDDYNSKFPDIGDDEDENASEVAMYSDNLSIEHNLEKQLRDVNKALEAIANGKYGICKHCGKEIEEGRLLARPVSTSCVNCKKALKGE